jgi:hypothetical protein
VVPETQSAASTKSRRRKDMAFSIRSIRRVRDDAAREKRKS